MAYNSSAYIGVRVTQLILIVVVLLVIGLIDTDSGHPAIIDGLFPSNNNLSGWQLALRGISLFGSFLLYPFVSLFITCGIWCCARTIRPHVVTICFDAFGIVIFLITGIVFVVYIKENRSTITDVVKRYADYLPCGLAKVKNSADSRIQMVINNGIGLEKATHVMEGCLAYFVIQIIFCSACIYLAAVYKRNHNKTHMVLLNSIDVSL